MLGGVHHPADPVAQRAHRHVLRVRLPSRAPSPARKSGSSWCSGARAAVHHRRGAQHHDPRPGVDRRLGGGLPDAGDPGQQRLAAAVGGLGRARARRGRRSRRCRCRPGTPAACPSPAHSATARASTSVVRTRLCSQLAGPARGVRVAEGGGAGQVDHHVGGRDARRGRRSPASGSQVDSPVPVAGRRTSAVVRWPRRSSSARRWVPRKPEEPAMTTCMGSACHPGPPKCASRRGHRDCPPAEAGESTRRPRRLGAIGADQMSKTPASRRFFTSLRKRPASAPSTRRWS